MLPRQYFPLGMASGDAFCNREDERQKLVGHLESGKHVFIVAPRRYGKSSLCEKVFAQSSIPWAKLDFFLATSEKDVERIILAGVSDLIGKAIGRVDKLVHIVKQYVKKLQPKFSLGSQSLQFELTVSDETSPAENIAEALLLLEKLLAEKKKMAVILCDEFQEVGEISQGRGIEGAIRHIAQETKYLSIIFSGSNPHLLKNMFEDERRPLYKLCRKLSLTRITIEHYQRHLNKAAKAMWNKPLDEAVFQRIMQYSQQHPYYVNYICDEIWSVCATVPTIDDVDQAWTMVVEEEKSDLLKDFFTLSENQRKIMIHIANHGGVNVYANESAKLMDIPISSIGRALSVLLERDYIEKIGEHYRLMVPVYQTLLLQKPGTSH